MCCSEGVYYDFSMATTSGAIEQEDFVNVCNG